MWRFGLVSGRLVSVHSKPIDVWKQRNVVVDGHTRLKCARALGIEVSVYFHDFADEAEALRYAAGNQDNRRNYTNADRLRLVEALREKRPAGRPTEEMGQRWPINGRESERISKIIGVGKSTVKKAISILDHAETDPSVKEAVLSGKESINMGARKVSDAKKRKCVRRNMEPRPVAPTKTAEPPVTEARRQVWRSRQSGLLRFVTSTVAPSVDRLAGGDDIGHGIQLRASGLGSRGLAVLLAPSGPASFER